MSICLICDDSGLQNSDSTHPVFCFCAAGKQAQRQWEASKGNRGQRQGQVKNQPRAASFIDIANLDEVNASVEAMRASLLGSVSNEASAPLQHPAVQLLYKVAHANHEVSVAEATQLFELAKTLESFLGGLAPIGRNVK